MAAYYCAFVVLLFLVRGASPFERRGVSLGAVLLLYVFGGLSAGAIVGLLRPITRARAGAMLVGIPAAVPTVIALVVLHQGMPGSWDEATWRGVALLSGFLGSAAGFALWSKPD